MKLVILCVGRLKGEAERDIVARYLQRFAALSRQLGFGEAAVIELSESRAADASARKRDEAARLMKKTPADGIAFALDEGGLLLSSAGFAERLGEVRDRGARNLCFAIGGPDGLDPEYVRRADLAVSFGRMTMPHGLVRAILAEQLYRAATILSGHPYHRD